AAVADTDMGTQIIGASVITKNGKAGVEVGGSGQGGNTFVLIANSFIDSNTGAGILAAGSDDPATFVSLASNFVVANAGPGLNFKGAHLRASTVGGTANEGFSKNDVEHNGFAASDTTCLANETVAQIVFDGPLAQIAGSTCNVPANNTQGACEVAGSHCVFNTGTSQCFYAYWLQGSNNTGTCSQQTTHVISGD